MADRWMVVSAQAGKYFDTRTPHIDKFNEFCEQLKDGKVNVKSKDVSLLMKHAIYEFNEMGYDNGKIKELVRSKMISYISEEDGKLELLKELNDIAKRLKKKKSKTKLEIPVVEVDPPAAFRAAVGAIASQADVDDEFAVMHAIGAVAFSIVDAKINYNGITISPNEYIITSGETGYGKTRTHRLIDELLLNDLKDEYEEQKKQEIERLKFLAENNPEAKERIYKVKQSRFISSNITPEAMLVLMQTTGTINIMTAESDFTDLLLGYRFKGKTAIEQALKGWSGEDIDYTRVGTGQNITVRNAKINILSSVQGEAFDRMAMDNQAKEKGFHSRVLIAICHRKDAGRLKIKGRYRYRVKNGKVKPNALAKKLGVTVTESRSKARADKSSIPFFVKENMLLGMRREIEFVFRDEDVEAIEQLGRQNSFDKEISNKMDQHVLKVACIMRMYRSKIKDTGPVIKVRVGEDDIMAAYKIVYWSMQNFDMYVNNLKKTEVDEAVLELMQQAKLSLNKTSKWNSFFGTNTHGYMPTITYVKIRKLFGSLVDEIVEELISRDIVIVQRVGRGYKYTFKV